MNANAFGIKVGLQISELLLLSDNNGYFKTFFSLIFFQGQCQYYELRSISFYPQLDSDGI